MLGEALFMEKRVEVFETVEDVLGLCFINKKIIKNRMIKIEIIRKILKKNKLGMIK